MIRCGNLQIDVAHKDVCDQHGQRAKLPPKAVELLIFLAEHPNQLITRELLLGQIWAGRIVEENALDQAIFQARLALGDHDRKLLVTVPRRGIELRVAPEQLVTAAQVAEGGNAQITAQVVDGDSSQTSAHEVGSTKASTDSGETVAAQETSKLAYQLEPSAIQANATILLSKNKAIARQRSWFWSGSMVIIGLLLALVFFATQKPRATNVSADNRPAVVAQAGIPDELIELLKALADVKGATHQLKINAAVYPGDVVLRLAGNAKGLLLQQGQDSEFLDPEIARTALRGIFVSSQIKPSADQRPSPAILPALLQAGENSSFPHIRKQLLNAISAQPEQDQYWNELSLLYTLSGRSDIAALLAGPKNSPPSDLAEVSQSLSLNELAEHLRRAKNLPDARASAKAIKDICASRAIARYSWFSAACALEQGLAEYKTGENETASMSLGYARSAFAKSGDQDSEKLVASLEHIAFVNSRELAAIDVSKIMQLSDVRAVSLLLRPIIMQKPKLAYELAEAALRSPAILRDYASATSIATALGLAARRSHTLAIKEQALGMLTSFIRTLPKGELRSSVTQSVVYLHFNMGRINQAIALIDADPQLSEPQLFRCARGNIYTAALRLSEARADFQDCLDRRARLSHSSLGMGLLASSGLVATARIAGDLQAANVAVQMGRAELHRSTGYEMNFYVGGVGFLLQLSYLERWNEVEQICQELKGTTKAGVCDHPEVKLALDAKWQPKSIPVTDLRADEIYDFDFGEQLIHDLYFMQKREGKCLVPADRFDHWLSEAQANGRALMLRSLTAIRDDCVNGRFAKGLEVWPIH